MNLEMVGGFNQTNLLISVALVMILMVISRIRKILNESGTWAAAIMGLVVAIGGHWTWLVTLLAFLSAGFFVTRWRYDEKKEMGFNEGEDGERDWTNVISNGGVPMLISLYAFMTEDWQELLPIFVASVAVATSDTFASEVGCLDNRVYMITTLKKCEPGLNGGFSPNGQIAALVGALLISLVATALGLLVGAEALSSPVEFIVSISIIGFLGCQIDSLLGALLENRGYIGKGTVNTLAIAAGAIIACYFHPIIGF
ncbi:MAG TPA: DUF92 domain-containing protein [Candidatus Poseidoniales archaeon]|nr:MAG TPA: DUF92 domain-containing protein [Candidatus Poseidoniales archaeon]HIH81804.1 DUF92 domain-containing protein [Candidatus Thalassarchaeaceae archaeon]|tara:strand:- start:1941 stop:2708 length:768 start_codon:yes stop_codon:yes gene_type:complete